MLNIKNVNVHYGKIQVLWNITFDVNRNEIVAILGPNSAGKSTLLKTILGLLRLSSGEIYFEGKKVSGMQPHKIVQEGIALVPERGGLFPDLTVLENLEVSAYASGNYSKFREILKVVFDLFPVLEGRKHQTAGTLSGGEQKMLVIARSLMLTPKLLMLDEPSSGLAPTVVSLLFDTIKQINSEGVTILLTEQNLYEALNMATKGLLIEEGKITLEGPPELFLKDERVRKAYLGI